MTKIDLNADLGESFGTYTIGCDAELMQIISSANIACGFHGGDPSIMNQTIKAAIRNNVRMGAHPGFNDLAGFGRRIIRGDSPEAIGHMILYQIGAFQAMVRANRGEMAYVKLHGALSNLAMVEDPLAKAFVDIMVDGEIDAAIMAMPHSVVETRARQSGVKIIREAFADRAYLPNGMLMSRQEKGSMILDAKIASENVLRMIEDQCITAYDGTKLKASIDSICVHGDNLEAVKIAAEIRTNLENAGIQISPIEAI